MVKVCCLPSLLDRKSNPWRGPMLFPNLCQLGLISCLFYRSNLAHSYNLSFWFHRSSCLKYSTGCPWDSGCVSCSAHIWSYREFINSRISVCHSKIVKDNPRIHQDEGQRPIICFSDVMLMFYLMFWVFYLMFWVEWWHIPFKRLHGIFDPVMTVCVCKC